LLPTVSKFEGIAQHCPRWLSVLTLTVSHLVYTHDLSAHYRREAVNFGTWLRSSTWSTTYQGYHSEFHLIFDFLTMLTVSETMGIQNTPYNFSKTAGA
jgi:hypothetical protein